MPGKLPILLLMAAVVPVGRLSAQFVDPAPDLLELPQVPDGFEVALYAREPLVRNPCSMAFDARGRMFAGMGPQYRNPTPETPPDRVVILLDSDGDGLADRTHSFASGFNCIQGLAWHGRDLWVANAPDLTVVRDLDGDDVADEYIRVFTDLGNLEHGLHGLNWAPDGRLYMSKGNSKGLVIKDWKKDEPDRLAPKPFRDLWGVPGPSGAPDFPPQKTFPRENYRKTYQNPADDWGRMGGILRCDDMGANPEIVSRGLRNPYGIAFDDGFDWLGTDQDQNEGDRIIMPFYGADFGWSHPWSSHWTGGGHLPTVPISGPVFSGSGTGILHADSPAWPDKFRKVWLINDWLLKSTQLYRPEWDGALRQPEGGKWEDFIVGKAALFRPVDMAFGADGALYILGWGRGYGVEYDKAGQMSNEGRIFRVMPKGAIGLPPPVDTPLPELSVAQLIDEFASILPVRRINAQDELARRGSAVQAALAMALQNGKLDKALETWTVWALARSGAPDEIFREHALTAPSNLRLQALRILGHRRSSALAAVLDAALGDKEPRLRFAAIQAVHQGRQTALADQLIAHAALERDRLVYYATWRALRDLISVEQLKALLPHGQPGIRCAALLALLDLQALSRETLQALTGDPDNSVKSVAMLGLGKASDPPASPAVPAAARDFPLATNPVAESQASYATGFLSAGQPSYTDRPYTFQQVPERLHGAFIIRTANQDEDSQGNRFLTFDLPLEATVMVAHDTRLPERPAWLQSFADTDLTVTTTDTTFRLWSKDFPAGSVTLGGNLNQPAHGKANYFVVIQPRPLTPPRTLTTAAEALAALNHPDPTRGEGLFFHSAACATCHIVDGRGTNFGPDLTRLGDRMEAKFIVQSLLAPDAVITGGFSAHAVVAGGRDYFGILLSTGKTLKLGLVGGGTVELPADTVTRHETLPVSPMPPQGALLGPQEVADITAWLLSQKGARPTPTALPDPARLPAGDGIRFELRDERIVIAYGGKPLADYVFRDSKILRPYFANIHTLDGLKITRNHPPAEGTDAHDHAAMHPGIWLGFGDLDGHDFWRNEARIEHLQFSALPAVRDGILTFTGESRLLTPTGDVPGFLTNQYSIKSTPGGLLITWDALFRAGERGLTFGDQEEMGFGARVATALTEKNGGLITSSTGLSTAAKTWGQPAAWCDYSGTINGRPCGITLMTSPDNFRPSWWHNRDYGVFVANPFGRAALQQGEKSRVPVQPGGSLRLRFAAMIHSGSNYDPAAAFQACYPP